MKTLRSLRRLFVLAVMDCLSAATAQAAAFTVTNTHDTGAGSLRLAVTLASGTGEFRLRVVD